MFAAILRRRNLRKNVSKFATLIETPATTAFKMPAGAKLRFVSTDGSDDGDTAATLAGAGTRTIKTPQLDVGQSVVIDWVAPGIVVTPSSSFDCELDTGLGVWKKIFEG